MIIMKQGLYIKPKRLWLFYLPGAACLLAGLLILLAPKAFAVVMASLFIAFALVLLYATRKFCLFVRYLERTAEPAGEDVPEAVYRFFEQEMSQGQWIN